MYYNWINIAKGLGAVAVVLYHTWSFEPLSLVRMPLFFFLSGYLFKPAPEKEYFIRKSGHLLVPYLFFLAAIFAPFAISELIEKPYHSEWKYIRGALMGGNYLPMSIACAFWFPTCLFIAQQIYNHIYNRHRKQLIPILCLSLALAYANDAWCGELYLPWGANVALYALPLIWMGHMMRTHQGALDRITLRYGWLMVAGAAAAVAAAAIFPLKIDLKHNDYGIPLLSMACSVVGILGAISLTRVIERHLPHTSTALGIVGRASMLVMYLHMAIRTLVEDAGVKATSPLCIAAQIAIPVAVLLICDRFELTRRLMIGTAKPQTAGIFHTKTI